MSDQHPSPTPGPHDPSGTHDPDRTPARGVPRADVPPPPQPPAPAPAPGAARPGRRGRVAAWTAGGVAVALVLVTGGVLAVRGLSGTDEPQGADAVAAGPADLGDAEFADVQLGVPRDHEFALPVEWQLEDLADAPLTDDVVQVYVDPRLTVVAEDAMTSVGWDGALHVKPSDSAVTATLLVGDLFDDQDGVEVNEAGTWGLYETYYIAEYRDRATGAPLDEPRVTAFTPETELPTTPFAVRVDGDGVGHFSWEPVDGAEEYYVVKVDELGMSVIGTSTGTSWTTIEQDDDVQEALAAEDLLDQEVIQMNRLLESSIVTEDDALDGLTSTVDDPAADPAFGVMAVTEEGFSPVAPVNGADLVSRLPSVIAFNAAEEMGVQGNHLDTVDQLPTQYPISLADGTTVLRPIAYDPDRVETADIVVSTTDDAGNIVASRRETHYRIPFTVVGTMFADQYTVEAADMAAAQAGARAATERAAAERARTGGEQAYTYVGTNPRDLDDATISTSAPDVPYPVSGSNPLTTYIAANLVDGQKFIDLSAYLEPGTTTTATGVALWDAVDEAVAQNPMALAATRVEVGYLDERSVLFVSYSGFDSAEQRRQEQEQLGAEVQRVIGEIITDGMSEERKVAAINDYLVSTAAYDDAALAARDAGDIEDYPHGWVASGVLLDGLGVCASYAQGFKALADAAGLESVYVTGVATGSGEGHAWNKVRVGESWRVVDVTWNDSAGQDLFLLQTDEQAAPDRTEDADWVVDSRIADYAAR
ncbi:transglutaminase domain-containing protein [Cellulomonas hominis]|uniref:transglutaminase domain-containing protein n=1 Tax=Cellulomonas hominis TaxID=156981 RepID=UPI001BCF7464|nr:transglutaminase domain-containing protein [Cellulomonas hominis]